MEVDEPYDFTTWHGDASAVKDKKKDKVYHYLFFLSGIGNLCLTPNLTDHNLV